MRKNKFFGWCMILVLMLCFGFTQKVNAANVIETKTRNDFATVGARLYQKYNKTTGISSQNRENYSSNGSSKYELKRLIVKSKGNDLNFEEINAAQIVKGPDQLYLLQFNGVEETRKAAGVLAKQSGVQYVEPDQKISLPKEDTIRSKQAKSSGSAYGKWSWGVAYMGMDHYAEQVKSCVGSTAIKIAVVDSGIYKHPAFSGHIISGHNLIPDEYDTNDMNGHGTHVTGTIYDCLRGFNVKIMPVRVLDENGEGNSFAMGMGIRIAAEEGAKVINVSTNLTDDHDEYLHESISVAVKENAVVVNSAGNNAKTTDSSCPADVEEAIVVGAIDSDGNKAYFSNTGNSIDVVAPGVSVYSTYLEGGYTTLSGTSMAAPHITGLATLMRLAHPSYSAKTVESKIKEYAKTVNYPDDKGMPYVGGINLNPVSEVKLNKSKATLKVPETLTLTATVTPSNATRKNVTWSSSNTAVAEVSGSGKVIAKTAGTATITVKTLNGKTAQCVVTVKAADKLPRSNFSLKSYDSSAKKAVIQLTQYKGSSGIQVQLQNTSKKTLDTKNGKTTCTFTKRNNQKVYYYRARAYYDIDGKRIYGSWSDLRIFSTAYATVKKASNHKKVTITVPKVTGVKQFELWVGSENQENKYKKIRNLAPGKSYTLCTLYNKKLTSYGYKHKFYVMIKPVYSISGMKDEIFIKKSFTLK